MPSSWISSTSARVVPNVARRARCRAGSSVLRIVGTVTLVAAAASPAVANSSVGASALVAETWPPPAAA